MYGNTGRMTLAGQVVVVRKNTDNAAPPTSFAQRRRDDGTHTHLIEASGLVLCSLRIRPTASTDSSWPFSAAGADVLSQSLPRNLCERFSARPAQHHATPTAAPAAA